MIGLCKYKFPGVLILIVLLTINKQPIYAQQNIRDTILSYAVIYNGDTIEAKTLPALGLYSRLTPKQMSDRAKWTRLRNAIYVTYPYARRAGAVMNDINAHLTVINTKEDRKKYIQTREKELKKEFTDPLTNLSIYQGKVLMKLINRQTGNNCYEIIKEYKGAFTARIYQTVAFFFTTNLKQPYDKSGDDAEMEKIVQEVERMYGYRG
ncbi:MAG: DUF4294 domain-containing protein [Ferruginibacter sp.]